MTSADTEMQRADLPAHGRRVRRDAEALAAHIQEAAGQIENQVAENMAERPWTTLAVAAGAGFVLGGGLATRITRLLLGLGGRLAFAMLMQEFGRRTGLASGAPNNDSNRRNR
jgi:surfactin synthase thioesterase subunit